MPFCAGNLLDLLETDLARVPGGSLNEPSPVGQQIFRCLTDSIRKSLLKKFIPKGGSKEAKRAEKERNKKALAAFLEDNEICSRWKEPEDDLVKVLFNEMKVSLDDFFHPDAGRGLLLSFTDILSGIDVGNGANIGTPNVDFYSKVCMGPITYGRDRLRSYLDVAFSESSPWRALLSRSPYQDVRFMKVAGSKICFAQKNAEIARTIAEEPLAEMLFQKGIEFRLCGRIRQVYNIDFEDQQLHNRRLARLGSIDQRVVTLDLRGASNRNAYQMVRALLPPTAFRWLDLARTDCAVLPNGEAIELHMLSSMGNAYTFPLQTLIFATAIRVVYEHLKIPLRTGRRGSDRNFAVFGDDIIVVPEASQLLIQLLVALGHEVNTDKSFLEGPFRESCGGDYCHGYNVRGVYIKRLDTVSDFYSSINRLHRWSSEHGIPLVSTIEYLLSQLEPRSIRFVPLHEADDAGIRVPLGFPSRVRYDKERGGHKYHALVTKARVVRFTNEDQLLRRRSAVLKAFERRKAKAKADGRREPKMSKLEKYWAQTWYNPSGHLLSIVGGKLWDGSYVLREFSRRTVVSVRYSPCWDYFEPSVDESRSLGHEISLMSYINFGTLM